MRGYAFLARHWRAGVAALCSGAAVACSSPGADTVEAGEAFPNLRMQLRQGTAPLGFVANRFDDTVSVVDLDALSIVGSGPVGRDPVVIDGARRLVYGASADAFYTVLSYPHEIVSPHVVEFGGAVRPGFVQMLGGADLAVLANQRAAQRAFELALAPDEGQLAVSHYDTLRSLEGETLQERRSEILLVDGPSAMARGFVDATSIVGCVAPSALEYDADGSRLFVACTGEDSLGTFDSATGTLLSIMRTGEGTPDKPWCLAPSPDRATLLVSNQGSDTLAVFDVGGEPRLVRSIPVGGVPFHVAWESESSVVVALQRPGGVDRVDIEEGAVVKHHDLSTAECENPSEPTVLPDGSLFLVCEGDHYEAGALVQLDMDEGRVVDRLELGVYPERMTVVQP